MPLSARGTIVINLTTA